MSIDNLTSIVESSADKIVSAITTNSMSDYIVFLGLFLGFSLFFLLFQRFLLHRIDDFAKKTKTKVDDAVAVFLDGLPAFFYILLSFLIAFQTLIFSDIITKTVHYIIYIFLFFYIIKHIFKAINFVTKSYIEEKEEQQQDTTIIPLMGIIVKIIVAIMIFIMILSSLGINVTGLLAGVGIGGIAIAFALQNILSDMFSSFSIYFDKPFKKGDFIIIGDDMGTVKEISLKSTRLQTLHGQELIIPNTTITNAKINNYKRMRKRRVVFTIGVTYSTPYAKLKKINTIISKILDTIEKATLDRVHFKSYGDFSLNYEIVYHVSSSDYQTYMDIQQAVNLELYKQFEKEGIDFAFPTQTIQLQNKSVPKPAAKK